MSDVEEEIMTVVTIQNTHTLAQALIKEGMLPKECVTVEILTADEILQLRYVVNVTKDQIPKIARAIAAMSGV